MNYLLSNIHYAYIPHLIQYWTQLWLYWYNVKRKPHYRCGLLREMIKLLELEQFKIEIDSLKEAMDEMGASL